MPTPQPQTISKEIVDALESLKQRDRRQAFILSRYKKQAEALVQISPAAGYTLLGIVACLEHDLEAMHANHRRAIAYDANYATLSNYSASLDKSFLWNEAFEISLAACDAEPADKAALQAAMMSLPLAGRFSLAEALSARWSKIAKGEPNPLRWALSNYRNFCAANNITEAQIQQILGAVERRLSKTTAMIATYSTSFASDDAGNLYLYYELIFGKEVDTFYYESVVDEAISSADVTDNVKDRVIFSVTGEDTPDILSCLDNMEFAEDDLVEPDAQKLELAKHLVEGARF